MTKLNDRRVWLALGFAYLVVVAGCHRNKGGGNNDGGAGSGGADLGGNPCGADLQNDPANCGSCGNACAPGQLCASGACSCPAYQSFCNGKCIPTVADGMNCGGCGKVCSGGQVCSAGVCAGSCQSGFMPCNGACVDVTSDSANCGGCNRPCPASQGCVDGMCRPGIGGGTPPSQCANGGPPIRVGGGSGTCAGGIAQTTFTWALCSCSDVANEVALSVDGYDSTKGPYTPPTMPMSLGAGIGANGAVLNGNQNSQMVTYGPITASWTNTNKTTHPNAMENKLASSYFDVQVGGALRNFDSGNSPGTQTVKGKLSVDGDVSGGTLTATQLVVTPGKAIGGTVNAPVTRSQVSVAPPCACGPSDLIDVAAIVAAARTQNDNALIGLNANQFATSPPANMIQRLDLPCGSYYLTAIDTSVPVTIVAHGHTALFIEGDISNVAGQQPIKITLDPTATLDVFVKGTIRTASGFVIGSQNFPALTRTYVGGSTELRLSAVDTINGNLYDAAAQITFTSANNVFGAVFAGSFLNQSNGAIHYDVEVLKAGDGCPTPTVPDGGTAMPCGTCRDCGNQACINGTCGACTSSAQCCPPLICSNGTCVAPIQ